MCDRVIRLEIRRRGLGIDQNAYASQLRLRHADGDRQRIRSLALITDHERGGPGGCGRRNGGRDEFRAVGDIDPAALTADSDAVIAARGWRNKGPQDVDFGPWSDCGDSGDGGGVAVDDGRMKAAFDEYETATLP